MVVSNVPPIEAIAAMEAGVARVVRRVEIYESDGSTLWVPQNNDLRSRLITGSVGIDYTRSERRILDNLELDNRDGMLDPDSIDGFWYDKIIKPFRGIKYPKDPAPPLYEKFGIWEMQLGEFMIDRIGDAHENTIVRISGRDYTKKCLTSKLEHSMSFPAGTYIYDLISALAANAGIRKLRLPFVTNTIGTQLDLERGTERWAVMLQAAQSGSYDLFFDNEGYLTMAPMPDPFLDAPFMSFQSGQNLVTYEKSVNDSELYNHVIVTSNQESVEGGEVLLPYFGEAKNTDPDSPTNVDRIGDRLLPHEAAFMTSDQQCRELAEALLRVHQLESYEINWSSIVYPHADVGKVVQVVEPKKGTATPTKFLLDTLNLPLGLEPMSATGKRVVITG